MLYAEIPARAKIFNGKRKGGALRNHPVLVAPFFSLLLLFPAVSQAQSSVIYTPSEAPPALRLSAAKATFDACSRQTLNSTVVETRYFDDGFLYVFRNGQQEKFQISTIGKVTVMRHGPFSQGPMGSDYSLRSEKPDGSDFLWGYFRANQEHLARQCAAALHVISLGIPPEDPAEVAQFDAAAKKFREASVKPEFPEEARRYRVQAEAAFKERRYDDAVSRYGDALKVVPWWPEGRFNRAFVLGELGRYTEAIREMKKYLVLVPDAHNVRDAQDQIYAWEDKVVRK